MKLRTEVNAENWENKIEHSRSLLLIGSCFTQNIGKRLRDAAFEVIGNPAGISFNPISIANTLDQILSGKEFSEHDLVEYDGLFHCWDFHSSFSGMKSLKVLEHMNSSLRDAEQALRAASHLVITFGTAWLYRHKECNQVVNNCHKFPADLFERRRVSIDEVTTVYEDLFKRIRLLNPDINIVLTLSPVRHWKDGAEENNVSKSVLRIAINNLCSQSEVKYFPAYEVVMDELRDYRFYADDMLHPNRIAQDFIWNQLGEVAFSKTTRDVITEISRYRRMEAHRSLHPGSEADLRFKKSLLSLRGELMEKYPQIHL